MDPTFRAYSAHNHILPHTWGVAPGYCISHRSEEHTSELQSRSDLVCRLLLEKKKKSYQPGFTVIEMLTEATLQHVVISLHNPKFNISFKSHNGLKVQTTRTPVSTSTVTSQK